MSGPNAFLTEAELADIDDDLTALMLAPSAGGLGVTLTWVHIDASAPQNRNPFSKVWDRPDTTESVQAIRGAERDTQTGEVIVGRYRYLVRGGDFSGGDPKTTDVIRDGTMELQVRAVRRSSTGLLWTINAMAINA